MSGLVDKMRLFMVYFTTPIDKSFKSNTDQFLVSYQINYGRRRRHGYFKLMNFANL